MKMTSRAKKQNPLEKKIPRNPKYENIAPTIDTGASLTKHMKKLEEINRNYRFRKNELFKRMKVTTFVQLLIQVHRANRLASYQRALQAAEGDPYRNNYSDDDEGENNGTVSERADTEVADDEIGQISGRGLQSAASLTLTEGDFGAPSVSTHRSTLQSVIRGVGEFDIRNPSIEPMDAQLNENIPYLLLDVRDADDYAQCHIISALSYPPPMLSRSINSETNQMRSFRNVPGRIIVVYDEDERIAPNAATILVQRGYDNLFLLSGGLKVALKVFPTGLITGTPPKRILTELEPPPGKTARSVRSTASSRSIMSEVSEQRCANQDELNDDDIDKLENYLDMNLMDKTRLSSSQSTSRSINSRLSRSTASTISEKPPFR